MLNSRGYLQRGVSLVEVLVALFILSVVGVAILGGAYVNVKSTGVARENILAEGLAKYELEYMKSVARNMWSGLPNQQRYTYTYTISSVPTAGPSWETTHNGSDLLNTTYKGYTVTITIDKLALYDDNIRKVNAVVVNPQGVEEARIDTYVVKP